MNVFVGLTVGKTQTKMFVCKRHFQKVYRARRHIDSRFGYNVSLRRADVAPTLTGQTTVWQGSTGKVTVEQLYAYGGSHWTPYFNHDCIFKIHLRFT